MTDLAKAYDPKEVESRQYAFWLKGGYFKPEFAPESAPPFCIIMPPPNVTGELHLGHALTATIEDALTRWHRMRGDAALWLPGRDHASIAAQLVVERELVAQGKTRHELGREVFLQKMWEWMDKYGAIIGAQHRALGVSVDWDREKFTMDPGPARAVRTAFLRLYEKGLIYRGNRITNWCSSCETALSDLEVIHSEEQGTLWYVRYPLEDSPSPQPSPARGEGVTSEPLPEGEAPPQADRPAGPRTGEGEPSFIEIATTRPETILADTGIAVHPEDPRFADLVGRTALVPSVNRPIPIVADEAVQKEFGTGAVKITPGHDPTDFEIGQRHSLPTILVIGLDGRMNDQAGRYQGMPTDEARRAFVEELGSSGLLVREQAHPHQVGHCYRCGKVVEPLATEQWYIRIQPLADAALAAVRDGRIRIVPERFSKVYFNWLENIRDWCISRQLWWGHRIPVFTCGNGHVFPSVEEQPTACPQCGSTTLVQDPDVLDTWFSSALWPFSTLGWPDDTSDLRRFYPTVVMETGYDILFFWVARMIMMGLEMMGDVPFRHVYLHGLIRVGREKMSKTKGNVLNPLELMEEFGTDALRISMVSGTTPGNDTEISKEKLEANRNFVNKLWNAGRFVLANLDGWPEQDLTAPLSLPPGAASEVDRWIVSRANDVTAEVTRQLEDFQFGEAARTVRDFLWGEFCDWYVEMAKIEIREAATDEQRNGVRTNLAWVFERLLRLLHPFAPFVTEELWQRLVLQPLLPLGEGRGEGGRGGSHLPPALAVAPWPIASGTTDREAETRMEGLMDLVRAVRNLRSEYKVDPARWVGATIVAPGQADFYRRLAPLIGELPGSRLRPIAVVEQLTSEPDRAVTAVAQTATVYIQLADLVDLGEERARLERERAQVASEVERAEGLLSRPGFVEKARPDVVAKEREKLDALRERLSKLDERLRILSR